MTLNFRICHGPGLADPRERKCRVVGTCGEKRPCVLRWACPRGGDRVRKSLEGYGTNKHDMFYFNQQDYMCWSHMSHMSICIHTWIHTYMCPCAFFFVWRSYRNSSNLSIPFPFPMIGSLKWLGDFPTTVTAWSSVFSKGFNQFLSAVCADYSSFLVLCYPVVGWRFMHAILIFHDHDSWRRIRWSTPRCPEISQQMSYNWNQLNISANHTPSPGS